MLLPTHGVGGDPLEMGTLLPLVPKTTGEAQMRTVIPSLPLRRAALVPMGIAWPLQAASMRSRVMQNHRFVAMLAISFHEICFR